MSLVAVAIGTVAVGAIGSVYSANKAAGASKAATEAQARAAADSVGLGYEQLDFDKQQYEEGKPLRDKTSAASLALMESQSKLSDTQARIAADYDEYNKSTFRPVEQAIVADATGYDTPERRAAAQAEAAASVEGAYGNSIAGLSRQLQRTGDTLGGGRSQALLLDANIAKAGAIAGATTGASRNVETIGHARMVDAASLGRGLPAAQATAAGTAISAANGATAAGTSAINQATAGIGAVNQGYSGAIGAVGQAGNLYGQVAARQGTNAANETAWMSQLGGAAGQWAGTSAGSSAISGWLSDEKKKKGTGKKLDGKKALKSIEDTPVHEGWEYDPEKGGPDEGGRKHDGPMAQDVARAMPEVSDGHTIDPVSMNGRMMAGMQELSKRMGKLERKAA